MATDAGDCMLAASSVVLPAASAARSAAVCTSAGLPGEWQELLLAVGHPGLCCCVPCSVRLSPRPVCRQTPRSSSQQEGAAAGRAPAAPESMQQQHAPRAVAFETGTVRSRTGWAAAGSEGSATLAQGPGMCRGRSRLQPGLPPVWLAAAAARGPVVAGAASSAGALLGRQVRWRQREPSWTEQLAVHRVLAHCSSIGSGVQQLPGRGRLLGCSMAGLAVAAAGSVMRRV